MYTISKTVTFPYSDFFNRDAFSWIKKSDFRDAIDVSIYLQASNNVQYIKNLYDNVLQTLSLQKYVNWCVL